MDGRTARRPAGRRVLISAPARPSTFHLVLAFAAIYLVWGSTYLAIKAAMVSLPAFFMAGSRFLLAGSTLFLWLTLRGRVALRDLTARRLALTALVGLLMLGLGNGLVVWSILHGAPTGLVAVLVAITPFWLVGLDRVLDSRRRITPLIIAGLLLGFAGIVVLSGVLEPHAPPVAGPPIAPALETRIGPGLVGLMLVATLAWACGSLLSRHIGAAPKQDAGAGSGAGSSAPQARSVDPLLAPALQMAAGGTALLAVSAATEPWSAIDLGAITAGSWIAYLYLVVFGSIIAYSAFIWLLRHVSAAAVGTYAYVNPVVAVALGALFLDETLTLRTAVASGLILGAVGLISLGQK